MNRILTNSILLLLTATSLNLKAQSTSNPTLFDGYANLINCPNSELEKAFTSLQGNSILLSLSNNTTFSGQISSSIQRYGNLKSVVIKFDNLQGAIFAISKRINDDNSIAYVGRIINERFADGYELKRDANGGYFLNKIKTNDLLQEHQ